MTPDQLTALAQPQPPKPTCDWCGARQADGFGPTIKMERPMISRRAAREGKREDEKQ